MAQTRFLAISTTGLQPSVHHVWEIALLNPDAKAAHLWQIMPTDMLNADVGTLVKTGFNTRFVLTSGKEVVALNPEMTPGAAASTSRDESTDSLARTIARELCDTLIVGDEPAEELAFLDTLVRRGGRAITAAATLDIRAMLVGVLLERGQEIAPDSSLTEVLSHVGVSLAHDADAMTRANAVAAAYSQIVPAAPVGVLPAPKQVR